MSDDKQVPRFGTLSTDSRTSHAFDLYYAPGRTTLSSSSRTSRGVNNSGRVTKRDRYLDTKLGKSLDISIGKTDSFVDARSKSLIAID